jgi:hypothetical protein
MKSRSAESTTASLRLRRDALNDFLRHYARKSHEPVAPRLSRLLTIGTARLDSASILLLAAGRRCLKAEVGGVVLVIDAKNENVAKWYTHYGAVPLNDTPLTLVLPLATIALALKATGQAE